MSSALERIIRGYSFELLLVSWSTDEVLFWYQLIIIYWCISVIYCLFLSNLPMVFPQMRPLIDDRRANRLDSAELRTHSQNEHHEEEGHRPEMRHRHKQHCFRIGDKRQTWSALYHFVDRHIQIIRHKSKHGKYSKSSKYGCKKIRCWDDNRVRLDVVSVLNESNGYSVWN